MALKEAYIRKIEYLIDNIPKRIFETVGTIPFSAFFTYEKLPLSRAKEMPREVVSIGQKWGYKWQYGWFFAQIIVSPEFEGKQICFSAKLGECIVYVNDEIVGAIDKKHKQIVLSKSAKAGEVFDVAMEVYAGHDGLENCLDVIHRRIIIPGENIAEFPDDELQKTVEYGSLTVMNEDAFMCLMDIKTLYDLRNNLDDNSLRKAQIDKSLKKVCDIIDLELEDEGFCGSIIQARECMRDVLSCKNGDTVPTVYAIGHSHLDLEWLWTKKETRRKIARTIGNQLKLIENNENYIYLQSQPWLLNVVKNEYPDLYNNVKEAIKSGNVIVEGGMWVEADTNIPSGESLIRQFLVGKTFFKNEFGVESKLLWLPDIFGCSAALPQIMAGCGIEYFFNAKITWLYDGGELFPHSNFMWQGIDGTRVLSFITQEYATEMTPSKVFEKWNMNKEKENVPIILYPFGYGDGGGGATREDIEYLNRENNLEGMPKVICKSPIQFFEDVKNKYEVNEEFVGELYYAAHRGSYTSQAKTKKLNRQCEFALRDAEIWTSLLGKGSEYKDEIDKAWKVVLFNQFHDIIPGTSITQVYLDAEKEYADVLKTTKNISNTAIKLNTDTDNYITLFNSLSWDRTSVIKLPRGYSSIYDSDGNKMQTQKIKDCVFAEVFIPAVGNNSYRLEKENLKEETVKTENYILENNIIIAKFNEFGELCSMIDKETGMEFIKGSSNKFRLFKDAPLFFDAWDIDDFYEKQEVMTENNEITIDRVASGDLISCLVIKRQIGKSQIIQKAILRKDEKQIDFETDVDWNETHKLLKVEFDTNINTNELISETQFGYIERPNHKSTKYDADRFEVCQHKWSALSESNRGFAVLNDSKYGIGADGGRISLTLLKSATEPALSADKGKQKFTYSVMLFTESFAESNVIRKAYELNCGINITEGKAEKKSFANIDCKNVILDTIKCAENSSDMIFRLYESKNMSSDAIVNLGFKIKEVYITDMLENNIKSIEVNNNKFRLKFRPFEVKTLRIVRS